MLHQFAPYRYDCRPSGLPYPARVERVIVENHSTRTLVLDYCIEAEPGQYVMAWIPGLDQRPFSLSNSDPLALTVARVGPFSSALHELRPGDRLGIQGPYGHGYRLSAKRALLVGGGYGVAPMAFLAQKLLERGAEVIAVIGARTSGDLLLVKRFERMGIEPLLTTEDGSQGTRGLVTTVVEPLLQAGAVDVVYACGPHPMLEALEKASDEAGIPAQLSWEAKICCAIGLCGSCEHKGVRLCTDGPVLLAGVDSSQGR